MLIERRDFATNRELLDWLLDHGADINRTDTQRLDTGFNLAIGEKDFSLHLLNKVAAAGDIDLFDYLVSRGAQPSKSTALHAACRCNDPERSVAMIRHLLDVHHMDINSDNEDFRHFFHYAHDRGSPLCIAILQHNLPAVREFLQRGADPDLPYGNPASYAIDSNDSLPALDLLLRAGADPTRSLSSAVGKMSGPAVQRCLAFGADPGVGLREALDREESRLRRIAEDAAFREGRPDLCDDEDTDADDNHEGIEIESKCRAIIDLLRTASAAVSAA